MTPRRAQDRFDDVLEATSYARKIGERGRATFDADLVWTALADDSPEVAEMVWAVRDELGD